MSTTPETIHELGLRDCLYLWALLVAQNNRLAIAPTKRMAFEVLSKLQERGIVELGGTEPDWEFRTGTKITPMENLRWRMTWTTYVAELLTDALEDYFDTVTRDACLMETALKIWNELASAESEGFFEQQLVKHGFAPEWAQDMSFAIRNSTKTLTIAQWRYCGWAAVRRGASMALQQNLQPEGLREIMYEEILRRAAFTAGGASDRCSLPPFKPRPTSALAFGFAYEVTSLESSYWTATPSLETICGIWTGAHSRT